MMEEEQRCQVCDDEIVDGTEEEENAAAEGLCPICYEHKHSKDAD